MSIAMTPRLKVIIVLAAVGIYGYGIYSGRWDAPEFVKNWFRDKNPEERYIEAIERNDINTVQALLEKEKVPVDTADSKIEVFDNDYSSRIRQGDSGLVIAAKYGHLDIARLLLKKKAKVNYQSAMGMTPLLGAANYGNTEMVKLLLKHKARPDLANNLGNTPLMVAASSEKKQDNAGVAKALLDAGANRNAKNKRGKTAKDLCKDPKVRPLLDS